MCMMTDGASVGPTLLLVHLSSLDAYTDRYGPICAHSLRRRLRTRIAASACVVATDQGWPCGADSVPRRLLYRTLAAHPAATIFPHDEETDGWSSPMDRLADLLVSGGVDVVVVGGVWLDADSAGGCVAATAEALRSRGIHATIERSLCGVDEGAATREDGALVPAGAIADDRADVAGVVRVTLETDDGRAGVYDALLLRDGRRVDTGTIWAGELQGETSRATLAAYGGRTVVLSGDEWRAMDRDGGLSASIRVLCGIRPRLKRARGVIVAPNAWAVRRDALARRGGA